MKITYVGHATVQLEPDLETRLLTDPVLRPRVGHIRRIAAPVSAPDLSAPAAVLISHAHHDHLDIPSLRSIAPSLVLCPPGCSHLMRRAGVPRVVEMEPGASHEVAGVAIEAIELLHDGGRHPLARGRSCLGYLIRARECVFFAGDSGPVDLGRYAPVDVALLPVWGWGNRLGPGHMGPKDAARAAADLEARVAIPIHWGTLAGPFAKWLDDPSRPARRFAEALGELAPGADARVLPPGGSTTIENGAPPASA